MGNWDKISRRRYLQGAVVAGGVSVAGCTGNGNGNGNGGDTTTGDPNGNGLETIEIGTLPTMSFAAINKPYYMGALEERGIDGAYSTHGSGADIITFLTQDELQIGGGSAGAAALNAIYRDLPVQVVAPLHMLPPEGGGPNPIITREGSDIEDMSDLEGRPVAINDIGVSTGWMLNAALEQGGLTLDDVDLRQMPFPDMVPALDNEAIDACLISEPLAASADQEIGIERLEENMLPGALITTIIYNTEWAEENPDLANDFMVSYMEGARELYDNWHAPEHLEMYEDYADTPPELAENAVPPFLDPDLQIEPDHLQDLQEFMIEQDQGEFDEPLSYDEVVDDSYVEHALDELGEFEGGN